MLNLPSTTQKTAGVRFGGGLDTTTPLYDMNPGAVLGSSGYEPRLQGGYQRAAGYERFDGRTRPSDATIVVLDAVTSFSGAAVGDSMTGATSGATGVVAWASSTRLALTKVTGTWVNEMVKEGAADVGQCIANPSYPAVDGDIYQVAAADIYRADITTVTGSGNITGILVLNGEVFAMRNNAGATAQAVYKATTSGWTAVPLFYEVSFTAGSVSPTEGNTITQGANSATVKRVVLQSGTWAGGTAAGRFIVTAPTPGNFAAGVLTAGGTATLSGVQTAITLNPSGRWVWRVYNFGAGVRAYGADGVNKPVEFDGTTLVPINTGMSTFPSTVEVHKHHLFAAYGGSLQHSGIGTPYQWTVLSGAAEIATGDTLTELLSIGGSEDQAAMLALAKDSAHVLYGNSSGAWQLQPMSREVGCRAYSAQTINGMTLAFDEQGIRNYTPTQAYGNFSANTLTDHIRDQVSGLTVAGSLLDRIGGRYRIFFNDGRWLSGAPGKRFSWMWNYFPVTVTCTGDGEINGIPRAFFGSSNGYVYEIDAGRGLDGAAFEYWLKTAYTHLGSPGQRKALRRCDIDIRGETGGTMKLMLDFDSSNTDVPTSAIGSAAIAPPGGGWDVGKWDVAVWDGQYPGPVRIRVEGIGETVSMTLFNSSNCEGKNEITSAVLHYIMRRKVR